MSSQLVDVRSAAAPGGDGPNQDQVFATGNAAILLDGATTARKQRYDGGWFAETLGRRIAERLTDDPGADLAAVLADAISSVDRTATLGRDAPSSTVAIVRWWLDVFDILVLGDSPVIVFHPDNAITEVYDDRLDQIATRERERYISRLAAAGGGFGPEHWQLLADLQAVQRAHRNTDHGYWIASTDPDAANHAITRSFPAHDINAVLLASDGVSVGVTTYRRPASWLEAKEILECEGPEVLLQLIQDVEATDPDGQRWPRSKPHDDKAVVLVTKRVS